MGKSNPRLDRRKKLMMDIDSGTYMATLVMTVMVVTVVTVIATEYNKKGVSVHKSELFRITQTKLPASNLTERTVSVSGRFGTTKCCMIVQLDMRALKHKRYQALQQKRK